ncbi:conserved unknown protein [Ectocarpus siliculosus]|uniref:ParB/Sulfiredoxin domain-containing protein n=1 Tax=Ectocarpus siliculosus TaxID=2880 RepID=D7G9F9_ECTSI|nr:conserved unknown protein [Ectocarpus siliculosus]|eukprot:CBJ28299.1 conserved unknown protein [Ectocarpus siliculosus]
MFSSSVIRRGRCSLARPPAATRCKVIVVDRGQPQTSRKGQQHAAIHRCPAGAAATAPPARGGGAPSGEAAAGKVQGSIASCCGTKHNLVLGPGIKQHQYFLSETTGGTVNWRRHASTLSRGDNCCLSLRPGAASSALRSRSLQTGGPALQLDRRGFSAGQGPDSDHDGGYEYDYSSGDSGSDSECESESTLFGASSGAKTAAKTEEAGALTAVKEPPAKKNTKPRIPRNRRGGKGERNPSPTEAVQAVAVADGDAGTPAPSPEASEAPPKKAPKAKTPRKRRGNQVKRNPSPTAAAQAAEAADGEEAGTTATEAAADPPAANKAPKAKAPRKRRGGQGESSRSPNAGPKDAERKGAAANAAEAGTDPRVPKERKASFERARRAGVARRIEEGGGVPRDSDSGSGSGSGSEADSGGEGDEGSVPDESPFPWKEAETPPFTWQDPDAPVVPKPFLGGSGADGEKGGAAAGAEAKSTGGGGKSTRRRGQRKKTQQQQLQLQQEEHPVLGCLVADLKYKRVYVSSLEALEKVRVWEEARTLRPVHAAEIFEGKAIEAQKLEVRRVKEDGKEEKDENLLTKRNQQYVLGVVDGQHRLRALKMLADAKMWDHSERNVVVEVFDAKDERDIEELYAEINRAEPVQIDLDIPGPQEVYKCAEEVVLHLYKLIRTGLIERHELFTPHLLLDFLLRVNEMMSRRDVQTWALMVGDEEGCYYQNS